MNQTKAIHPKAVTMRLYTTSDLPLTAYLKVLGHPLIECRNESGRGFFAFQDSEELRADIIRWGNDEPVRVSVRRFTNLLRDLKGMIGAA
jgi:hypothetical protein